MNKYFSNFQTTIFYFVLVTLFFFFIFFSFSKFSDIFRSVYLQENQSVESYNFYSMSAISTIENSYNNIFKSKNLELPEIRIYLKENSLRKLTENLPKSKNQWIDSFLLSQNEEKLLGVKIKIRGDNPNNWLHQKKSYRIKFGKKNLLNFNRTLDYIIPRDSSLVNTYLGYYIAERMNIITPNVRFINLYINDDFKGLYLEVERTNESFLRKRNIMPVNIYNGAPSRTNVPFSSHNDLFINSYLWEKQSFFNRLNKNNSEDLVNFLNVLIESVNSKSAFNKLKEISNIDEWAKYSAYETIMQSWHSYENNNMRILSDNWKGEIVPIAYDAIFNDTKSQLIINENIIYDNAPHLLTDTLLKSSEFNLKKFSIIKKLIDDGIFKDIKKEIDKVYDKIKTSWYADPNHYQFVVVNKFSKNLFFNRNMDQEIIKLKKRVDFIEKNLKEIIYKENIAKWSYENTQINFFISSVVPVSSINICYKNKLKTNKFYFKNLENLKIFKYNLYKNLNCYKKEVSLISDRIKKEISLSKPTHFVASSGYKTINTNFILNNFHSLKPEYIFYKTHNSNEYLIAPYIKKIEENYYFPNIHNKPEFKSDDLHTNLKVFEGLNIINDDLIIKEPVIVKPGTKFILKDGASIIFKKKAYILGKKNNTVIFTGYNKEQKWGTISIEGENSIIKNAYLIGGFGDILNNKFYTSMLSVRNTKNILLENIKLDQNYITNIPNYYDDLLHVIYSSNVKIINSSFYNSIGDAIDVDVSDVQIINSYFENSGNDSIDFMSSKATIRDTDIYDSGDKGISVGENSKIDVLNSSIHNSFIGIESKDNSYVKVHDTQFINNNIDLHGYNKNWRYGNRGGIFEIQNSNFISNKSKQILLSEIKNAEGKKVHKNIDDFISKKNVFISKDDSQITIKESLIHENYIYIGKEKNLLIKQ